MIIFKITEGSVVQVYDTEKKKFTSQQFVSSDEVKFVDENGDYVKLIEAYLEFDMLQPSRL